MINELDWNKEDNWDILKWYIFINNILPFLLLKLLFTINFWNKEIIKYLIVNLLIIYLFKMIYIDFIKF